MTDARMSVSTWSALVEQIEAGSESAVEELYHSLRSIRLFFGRQIGPQCVDDAYHNLVLDVVAAIRKRAIRNPETLPAYAVTIARRNVYRYIREMTRERHTLDVENIVLACAPSESPEQLALRSERQAIAERVLTALPPRDQEVLVRFYLHEESREDICTALNLTPTQFRLIKSRAKARYTELVQQSMSRAAPSRMPVQASAPSLDSRAIA